MLHLLDVIFEYWSPSKEIKHQLDIGDTYMSLDMMKYNMHPSVRDEYVKELQKIEPVSFDDAYFIKRLYHQFIIFFHDELLNGKTFKEALAEVKNDKVWYG